MEGKQEKQVAQSRQTFFLGNGVPHREVSPTPNSGDNISQRETSQTPLMPQGSLLMIDENKQPSALEITLADAPRVYREEINENEHEQTTSAIYDSMAMITASKSAYRHHLPRRGQPGCRVIKMGILARKRGSTQRRFACESGMFSLSTDVVHHHPSFDGSALPQNQKLMQVKIHPQGLTSEQRQTIVEISLKGKVGGSVSPPRQSEFPQQLNPDFLGKIRARAKQQASTDQWANDSISSRSPGRTHQQILKGSDGSRKLGQHKVRYHKPQNSDLTQVIDEKTLKAQAGVAGGGKQMMVVGVLPPKELSNNKLSSATQLLLQESSRKAHNNREKQSVERKRLNMGRVTCRETNSAANMKERSPPRKKRLSTNHDTGLQEDSMIGTFYCKSPTNSGSQKGIKPEPDLQTLKKQLLPNQSSVEREYAKIEHDEKQTLNLYTHTEFIKHKGGGSVDSCLEQPSQQMRIKIQEKTQIRTKNQAAKGGLRVTRHGIFYGQPNKSQAASSQKDQFDNPYNVTSFKKKKRSIASNKSASMFGNLSKDAVPPVEQLKIKSPDVITVKMLDKGDYKNKSGIGGNKIRLQQIIDRAPKMVNYEQLKRPKTNRLDLAPLSKNKCKTSCVDPNVTRSEADEIGATSQRMVDLTALASRQDAQGFLGRSEFASQQERRAKENTLSAHETGQGYQAIKTSLPGYRQFPGKKKTNQRRKFDSIDASLQEEYTKKSGLAGSSAIQEPMSLLPAAQQFNMTQQAMKQNSFVLQNATRHKQFSQRLSLHAQITAIQQNLASQDAARISSAATNSISDSADLIISGSKATAALNQRGGAPLLASYDFVSRRGGGRGGQGGPQAPNASLLTIPFRSVDYRGYALQGGYIMESPLLANDTSRSPIPIDPELSRHMMMQLPPNIDASSASQRGGGAGVVTPLRSPRGSEEVPSQHSSRYSAKQRVCKGGKKAIQKRFTSPPYLAEITSNSYDDADEVCIENSYAQNASTERRAAQDDSAISVVADLAALSQREHKRVTVASNATCPEKITTSQQAKIKEVNQRGSEGEVASKPGEGSEKDSSKDPSKLKNRSKRNNMQGTMSPAEDTSLDEQMIIRGSGEHSKLASRLQDAAQRQIRQPKQTTLIQTSGGEEVKIVQLRKQRTATVGRFRSMADAKPAPTKDLSANVNRIGIPVNTQYSNAHANQACLIAENNTRAVTLAQSPAEKVETREASPPPAISEEPANLVQRRQNETVTKMKQPRANAQNSHPYQQHPHIRQISRPVIDQVRHLQTISTEKLQNKSITTMRMPTSSHDYATRQITPRLSTTKKDSSGRAGQSSTNADRFAAGSVSRWDKNESSVAPITNSRKPTALNLSAVSAEEALKSLLMGGQSVGSADENYDLAQTLRLFINNHPEQDTTDEEEGADPDSNTSRMLKIDNRALSLHKQKAYGIIDFAAQKAREFLMIQESLPMLDHNSLQSDAEKTLNQRADKVMKNIALQTKMVQQLSMKSVKENSPTKPALLQEVNQQRNKLIRNEIPTHMIKFKNKSERERYLRVARCILSLPSTTQSEAQQQQQQHSAQKGGASMHHTDVEFTYMKIFRFLGDILSQNEFDSLSYYHVASFVQRVLHATSDSEAEVAALTAAARKQSVAAPTSLRKFVCDALDLRYEQSKLSQEMLIADQNCSAFTSKNSTSLVKPLWHITKMATGAAPVTDAELNELYGSTNYREPINKQLVEKNVEARHAVIHGQIRKGAKTHALEPSLPTVMQNSLGSKGKETIHRGNVARLLQVNKRQNEMSNNLQVDSNIARNKVVLEHIVYKRNLKDWRDQVLAELHEEQRGAKSVSNTRRTTRQYFK